MVEEILKERGFATKLHDLKTLADQGVLQYDVKEHVSSTEVEQKGTSHKVDCEAGGLTRNQTLLAVGDAEATEPAPIKIKIEHPEFVNHAAKLKMLKQGETKLAAQLTCFTPIILKLELADKKSGSHFVAVGSGYNDSPPEGDHHGCRDVREH